MNKLQIGIRIIFIVFVFILAENAAAFAGLTVTISPTAPAGWATVNEGCPTFSWSAESPSEGYEIAVFMATETEVIPKDPSYEDLSQFSEPLFTISIPAPALSWTPSASQRMEPGQCYIWFVRNLYSENSADWSKGALFKIQETLVENLDTAVAAEVTAFLNDDENNLTFWTGLENHIAEVVYDKLISTDNPANSANIGQQSLQRGSDIHDSQDNTLFGDNAGFSIDDYTRENVFFGIQAGFHTDGSDEENISSDYNTFVGNYSGFQNKLGQGNSYLGFSSGIYAVGSKNSYCGCNAGYGAIAVNCDGDANSFLGYEAGRNNTSGSNNTFAGRCSARNNSTGKMNVVIGRNAALECQTDTQSNVLIGDSCGKKLGGNNNTFTGEDAGYNNDSGKENVFIGANCGYNNLGSGNVFIGFNAGFNSTESNILIIDNSKDTTPLIYGDFSNSNVWINGSMEIKSWLYCNSGKVTCSACYLSSDQRWKTNIKPLKNSLTIIQQLEGVSYFWNRDEFPEKDFSKERQIGLIAQKVEKILPEVVNTDAEGYKSVAYSQIVPVLIETIKARQKIIEKQRQELKKQRQSLQAQIDNLRFLLDDLSASRL